MEKLGAKFFVILLAVLGVILLFVVGNNLVVIYRGSIGGVDTDEEVRRTVDCQQIVFDVVLVSDEILEIINTPLSSFDLDEINLIDAVSGEIISYEQTFFVPGRTRNLNISDFSSNLFYVVPFSCDNIARICNREDGVCYDPNRYLQ